MPDVVCSNCSDKKSHHSEKLKQNLILRLKKVEGQVRGVSKMIESDIYCDDVLNQLQSISQALNGVKKLLLEHHIKSCVVDQLKNNELDVIDELMTTIDKMLK